VLRIITFALAGNQAISGRAGLLFLGGAAAFLACLALIGGILGANIRPRKRFSIAHWDSTETRT